MSSAPVRLSPWYFIPLRALVITVIITLLSFAVSLLLGIIGTAIVAAFHGVHPNMAIAYRSVAFPVAIIAAGVGLIISLTMEVRQYRRARALGKMKEQFGRAG